MTLRTYRVGTFYHEHVVGKVLCYLRDYSPRWDGCIEYDVEAENGTEAKRKAKALRLDAQKRFADKCELILCPGGSDRFVSVNQTMDDGCWNVTICTGCADALGIKKGDELPSYERVVSVQKERRRLLRGRRRGLA